jgi:hypothetical protein
MSRTAKLAHRIEVPRSAVNVPPVSLSVVWKRKYTAPNRQKTPMTSFALGKNYGAEGLNVGLGSPHQPRKTSAGGTMTMGIT